MALMEIGTWLAARAGGTILWRAGARVLKWLKSRYQGPGLGQYKIDLETRIRSMPFIYKDLELNAVDDFVDVELVAIDSRNLLPQAVTESTSTQRGMNTGRWWRFTQTKKLVLMGEAGIGKTTIFRHLVLSILSHSRTAAIFPADEKLTPIFVPLKAIDANAASPILRYITQSHPIFTGDNGQRLLAKLARRRRLVLFLDGFDEIPHAGGVGLVSAELAVLFGAFGVTWPEGVSPEYVKLYDEMRNCRIYMSTRREFYATYRPKLDPNDLPPSAIPIVWQESRLQG